jgi:integrase
VTDQKHNHVFQTTHKGKQVLDISWPDYLRNRIRIPDDGMKANEMRLRIELAIADGSWQGLRDTLLAKKIPALLLGYFDAVADEYQKAWVEVHNRSVKSKRSFIDQFKNRWKSLPIKMLGIRHVDEYVKSRKSQVKPATINREIACLRHMLGWAVKRGYLLKNPLLDYEMLKEEPYARERVSEEIIEKVLSKLPPLFIPVFTLIWQTAARRGEILDLQHPQVDRQNRLIEFTRKTKSGKSRLVMITDRAMEALDAIPPLPGCPYVFYNPETGTRWSDCRKPWERARKAAGYPWLTPKHLRPALATDLSEKGLETHFVSELLGHSSVTVTERFYIKRRQVEACQQALRVIEGGKKKAS